MMNESEKEETRKKLIGLLNGAATLTFFLYEVDGDQYDKCGDEIIEALIIIDGLGA
jgi:hypothetical protein